MERRIDMGNLTQEITRIRDEIDSSHEARKAFIREMKASVSETRNHANKMVKKFSKNRTECSRVEKDTLTSFVSGVRANVGGLIEGFENDRAGMAQETKAAVLECVLDVKEFVSGLKADVDDMLEAFKEDRIEKGRESRTKLSLLLSGLRSDVDEMMDRFKSERADVARETNAALLESLSKTTQFVSDIKEYVFVLQKGFSKIRIKKAKENKKERVRFIADLEGEVSRLRGAVQTLRMVFKEDCRVAGDVWRGVVSSPSQDVPGTPSIPLKRSPMAHVEIKGSEVEGFQDDRLINTEKQPVRQSKKPLKEEELFPDDFTQIQGIGPGRQKRLNEAGIYTFAHLAESTTDIIQEALGGVGQAAGVDKWIAAAKKLSRKQNSH